MKRVTVYGLTNCDSVKRARSWLAEHGDDVDFHDFKRAGVPSARLDAWIAALGWQPLVNRSGSTWRKLDPQAQAAVTDAASARALMLVQPSVIKRPLVEWPDGEITVGLGAPRWDALRR